MKIRLADHLLKKLSELGQAIDIDRQFQVFDDGVVGIVNDHVSASSARSTSPSSRN